jgi:hypothetical protein
MPRRLNTLSRAKLRGIPRRLRTLQRWAEQFVGFFPDQKSLAECRSYWNWKIPVHWALVEGKQTSVEIQRQCAQRLIDACHSMIAAKPAWAEYFRVTCLISLPDMHSSELCIYLDEGYFLEQVGNSSNDDGEQVRIDGRSLAKEWQLLLPEDMSEHGVLWRYDKSPDLDQHYVSEHWHYGEIERSHRTS